MESGGEAEGRGRGGGWLSGWSERQKHCSWGLGASREALAVRRRGEEGRGQHGVPRGGRRCRSGWGGDVEGAGPDGSLP